MSTDDEIPVLNEVVFPGDPDKIKAKHAPPVIEEPQKSVHEELEEASSEGLVAVKPEGPDVSFIKDEINDIIETILQRHIKEAREEITEAVMKELYARLEP